MKSLLLSLLLAGAAAAHQTIVDAWLDRAVDPPVIRGECLYSSGKPVKAARVTVTAPDGALLGETATDDAGRFAFAPAGTMEHRIAIAAGQGHLGTATIPASDLGGTASPAQPAAANAPGATVEVAIRQAVAAEVAPLRRELAELRHQLWLRDILGGLGWVLGLGGLWALFKARSRQGAPRS